MRGLDVLLGLDFWLELDVVFVSDCYLRLEGNLSEEDRVRLYNWLCEHGDRGIAEYLMNALPPVQWSDMATKEFVTAELARYATAENLAKLDAKVDALDAKIDGKVDALDGKIDTKFDALDAKIDTKFDALDAKFDAKVDALDGRIGGLAAQYQADRAEDRRTNTIRHWSLVGLGVSIVVPMWLSAAGVLG